MKIKESFALPSITSNRALPANSISYFLTLVLPKVSRELNHWQTMLKYCHNNELLIQALSSLAKKRFHAQGASFFALYHPNYATRLIPPIVALQTISDYLDNLCDRANIQNEAAFERLHLALLDALNPFEPRRGNYYLVYPYKMDGGYLDALVEECRSHIRSFTCYPQVKEHTVKLASLYKDLQVYKHLNPKERITRLKQWFREKGTYYRSQIYWWEFAAACGSTLAIFALLALSTKSNVNSEEIKQHLEAYFPWVCGLHILLDYFIDQKEDLLEGDLNFAACYISPLEAENRMHYFLNESLKRVSRLPFAEFHQTVVKGLLAVYLSDPKVQSHPNQIAVKRLLKTAGINTIMMHRFCLCLRRVKIL